MIAGRTKRLRALAVLSFLVLPTHPTRGAEVPPAAVGSPTSVAVEPQGSLLRGAHATQQLIVSATYADRTVRDLTHALKWVSLNPNIATVTAKGRVEPRGNGSAVIVARAGSVEASAVVTVEGMEKSVPASFRYEVIPAISQAGCNSGACHGTPNGKGGFRLSLRGYLPDQDYFTLSRGSGGRRINPIAPETSLILRKPLGELPHEGGLRLTRNSTIYEILYRWINEGAKDDPTAPAAVRLEVRPGARVLNDPFRTQQIVAIVHMSDGSTRDVTPICYYNSSNTEIADVDPEGLVTFKTRGEVAIISHYLDLVANVRLTFLVDVPGFKLVDVPQDSVIDKAVITKLNLMKISPSEPSGDRSFIRRVYLDTIGTLPQPDEVEAFLNDSAPDRRAKVIDQLLMRSEFYDLWSLKFADILRSNGRLIQSKGAIAFSRWIRSNLERDVPLNQFVQELLTANGSAFSHPAANYYRLSRTPESAVEATAQLFMGVRIQCAKCHNHPFERWTQDDYYGLAAFFARVRQKKGTQPDDVVVYLTRTGDVRQPRTGQVVKPKALGGPILDDPKAADRRLALASWLTGSENPFFAKSLVNRVWYHLLGRGIVEPVDDFRDSNPASNDELLDHLTAEFVSQGFSLKKLIRSILLSRTYQLSDQVNDLNGDDNVYFSHAYSKLLPAEVLLDAISTVTSTVTKFGDLPKGYRATQIPDGKIDDAFLKTFGRPARDIACECERESDSNLAQALQLIGGATVNEKLRHDSGRVAALAKSSKSLEEITREVYLIALTREPTATELATMLEHMRGFEDRREAVEDLVWVLINSKEFLYRR
ncbi:DUF1553 domain-containing protein [Singulisphaera sp. Ch08]|uniref:DUF1553 domain-containing protein n=1 Tax=Singulisphaera sp. Ch08 TaxID=3120278 RepID=A0AAU7CHS5_9BACT